MKYAGTCIIVEVEKGRLRGRESLFVAAGGEEELGVL